MKNSNIAKLTIGSLLAAGVFAGCTSSTGYIADANLYKSQKRCETIDKDLIKVDRYIEYVENNSAFHLQEAGVALLDPDISTSTNKKQMLKDARSKKSELESERVKANCAPKAKAK